MIDLDKLEKLAMGATPGPWSTNDHGVENNIEVTSNYCTIATVASWLSGVPVSEWTDPNAKFIAAANPETVLKLIVRIRELEEEVMILENDVYRMLEVEDDRFEN